MDVKKVTFCGIVTKERSTLIDLFSIEAPIIDLERKLDAHILCSSNSGTTI